MVSALGKPSPGRPVELETERFRLRSLRPVDASERWLGWVKDPEVMHPTNAPVRHMTRNELSGYIASFDNHTRYLIGFFDKASGLHIGFAWIEVDRPHDTATFNMIIGEKSFWGRGVVNEIRAALLDYFFDKLGMAKVCGGPLSRNFPMIFNYHATSERQVTGVHGLIDIMSETSAMRLRNSSEIAPITNRTMPQNHGSEPRNGNAA